MRSHLNSFDAEKLERKNTDKKKLSSSINGEVYGLRENPKKTWRMSNSSSSGDQQHPTLRKSCKECGKAFSSSKALFGHMRCHSDKYTSGNPSPEKAVVDNNSDNETASGAAPSRRRRSRRKRQSHSSVSEMEQELEEVAAILMMLSRDVGNSWVGFNSIVEYSDNNSVAAEIKKSYSDGSHAEESMVEAKFGRSKLECEATTVEFRKESPMLTESDLSMEVVSCKKRGVGLIYDVSCMRDNEAGPHRSECGSVKGMNCEDLGSERGKGEIKRKRYVCTQCNRAFHSYQALGGHRASHKKNKGHADLKIESSENSEGIEFSPDNVEIEAMMYKTQSLTKTRLYGESSELLMSKSHECPICFKVFSSGQALGGHKRAHLYGNIDARTETCQTIAIQKLVPEVPNLLDLNLPVEEEEDENQFKSCWIGSIHKSEPLVGMISN